MAEKKKEVRTRSSSNGDSYTSPSARSVVADYKAGKINHVEAIDRLGGKGKSNEVRNGLARALGDQSARQTGAEIDNKVNNRNSDKTQTRKPGYAKGGMVTKANCGASMKPTQKKAK
jgi:hypothetical protein